MVGAGRPNGASGRVGGLCDAAFLGQPEFTSSSFRATATLRSETFAAQNPGPESLSWTSSLKVLERPLVRLGSFRAVY